MARAILADDPKAACNQTVADSAKVDKSHSERNAHRLFNRYGLSLRVPISYMEVSSPEGEDSISVPYLRLSDYARLLAAKYPRVLMGGLDVPEGAKLCQTFWERYKAHHPEHVVFEQYGPEDFGSLIPIYVHGDKGRTLQKSPLFVLSWETPFGLPPCMLATCKPDHKTAPRQFHDGKLTWTCQERAQSFLGKRKRFEVEGLHSCTVGSPGALDHEKAGNHQRHNSKGNSYLSRFLIGAVPSKVYKRNSNILPGLLQETASELQVLFREGIEAKPGVRLRFVFLGAKGDAEWHFEAGQFTRSYHNTSSKSHRAICPLCSAGTAGLSLSDGRDEPAWAATMGTSDPWDALPPLNHAPYSSTFGASLYKFDPFHVLKFGVFRDAVGSILIRLALMTYFDCEGESTAIESRLQRAFSLFSMWCLAERKFPAIKHFTKANLNFANFRCFPWLNAKGADITLVMMFLHFYLRVTLLEPLKRSEDLIPLQAMLQLLEGGLTYIGVMHSHGLWLTRACARLQLMAGFSFYRGYLFMADFCTQAKVAGFRLRPKIHYFHHLLYEVQLQLSSNVEFVYSAAAYLCEQNEDFIGRISWVSRRVAARTSGLRTTQRYLVKTRFLLERLCG